LIAELDFEIGSNQNRVMIFWLFSVEMFLELECWSYHNKKKLLHHMANGMTYLAQTKALLPTDPFISKTF
jgi:hypothetical protein